MVSFPSRPAAPGPPGRKRRHPLNTRPRLHRKSDRPSQRRPRTPKRSLTGGLPFRLRIKVACTWFVRPRALPHQLRPRRDPPAEDARLLIRQPDRGQKTTSEQLRERARVDLVRLRTRLRDPLHRLRIRQHHPTHMRLDDPRDPKRVAGRLQRDLIVDAETLRNSAGASATGPVCTRPVRGTLASLRAIATSQKSRCTSNPMNRIQHHLPRARDRRRRGGRHDNYGSVRTAHPDSRRGGHLQPAGSQPIMCDGLPNLRLPEAPGIRNAPTLPDDADTP